MVMTPIARCVPMLFACLLVFGVATRAARADDPPIRHPTSTEALAHLANGNKLYNVRDFSKAADEYKAGALVEPAPIFDYNLGQTYRQAGDYKSAIWYYERFLREDPRPGERTDAVKKFIAEMQAELDRQAMKEQPTEPAPASGTATPVTPASTAVPSQPASVVVTAHAPVERWYQDPFGWGLAGTGLVSGIIGGALLVDGASLSDEADHTPGQQEAKSLRDAAGTRTLLGGVVGVVGVGLLATGIVKLANHPSDAAPSGALSWNVGVSTNGVLVFGTF